MARVPLRHRLRLPVEHRATGVQTEVGTRRQTVPTRLDLVPGGEHRAPRGRTASVPQRRVDISPDPAQRPRSDPAHRLGAGTRHRVVAVQERAPPAVVGEARHQRTVGVHRTPTEGVSLTVLVVKAQQVSHLVRQRQRPTVQAPVLSVRPRLGLPQRDHMVGRARPIDELQLHPEPVPVGKTQVTFVVVLVHPQLGRLPQLDHPEGVEALLLVQIDPHQQSGRRLAVGIHRPEPLRLVAPRVHRGRGVREPELELLRRQLYQGGRSHRLPSRERHLGERQIDVHLRPGGELLSEVVTVVDRVDARRPALLGDGHPLRTQHGVGDPAALDRHPHLPSLVLALVDGDPARMGGTHGPGVGDHLDGGVPDLLRRPPADLAHGLPSARESGGDQQ